MPWTLSPQVAPQVVVMTTCGAIGDDKFDIMTTPESQFKALIIIKAVAVQCMIWSVHVQR